jgi:hypothetical protein
MQVTFAAAGDRLWAAFGFGLNPSGMDHSFTTRPRVSAPDVGDVIDFEPVSVGTAMPDRSHPCPSLPETRSTRSSYQQYKPPGHSSQVFASGEHFTRTGWID